MRKMEHSRWSRHCHGNDATSRAAEPRSTRAGGPGLREFMSKLPQIKARLSHLIKEKITIAITARDSGAMFATESRVGNVHAATDVVKIKGYFLQELPMQ